MWWTVAKGAAVNWSSQKDARQGAALAYYSVFSLGPIIVIAIAGLLFGRDAVTAQVMSSIKEMLGDAGSNAVGAMLAGASRPSSGIFATILGVATLLFAAIGVVVQLKDALNTVWDVEESQETGLWHFARNYVLSLAAVLALGFLLLVSLVVSAGLAAAGKFAGAYFPEGALHFVSLITSFVVVTILFAMMFKWLPDVSVGWEDVWLGAFLTALFFEVGKEAIGFYIGKQGLESTYGAAASIVVVLIWVYYTSQIILMGAEITHSYAKHTGSLKPRDSAEKGVLKNSDAHSIRPKKIDEFTSQATILRDANPNPDVLESCVTLRSESAANHHRNGVSCGRPRIVKWSPSICSNMHAEAFKLIRTDARRHNVASRYAAISFSPNRRMVSRATAPRCHGYWRDGAWVPLVGDKKPRAMSSRRRALVHEF